MNYNAFSRIAELWPRNLLCWSECRELCELIDKNARENGLRGRERERLEALVEKAEANEYQRPLRATDHT